MTSMDKELQKALNAQANRELFASASYMAASFWFDEREYDGICSFLRKESDEERVHSQKFFDYIQKRPDGHTEVEAMKKPKSNWESPQEVFNDLYNLEREFTVKIHDLMKLAKKKGDESAQVFLQEFVIEQDNSVDEWSRLVAKMDAYAALPGLLWHLNAELK